MDRKQGGELGMAGSLIPLTASPNPTFTRQEARRLCIPPVRRYPRAMTIPTPRLPALFTLCLAAGLAAGEVTPGLYAVDNIGHDLISINADAGRGTRIGNVGLISTIGIAHNPVTNVTYIAGTASGGVQSLYRIDPETAQTTEIGPLGPAITFGGLAWDGDGNLQTYQLADFGDGRRGDTYRIDTQTGAAELVTHNGFESVYVYDASYNLADGRIWFTDGVGRALYSMAPHNGPATFEVGMALNMEAIAFMPDGRLFGIQLDTGTDPLYAIDPATGDLTRIGDTRFDQLTSMTYIPAPGAFAPVGGLGLLIGRRRR